MKVLLLENISAVAVEVFRDAGYDVESLKEALDERQLVEKAHGVSILGVRSKTQVAAEVIRQGINMTIYVEGKRSFDGKLLPFKKGPFYLAMECNVPVIPITISGSHYVMPKRRFAIKPGLVQVIFHDPIQPKDFGSREALMEKVRAAIDSGLPAELQEKPNHVRQV